MSSRLTAVPYPPRRRTCGTEPHSHPVRTGDRLRTGRRRADGDRPAALAEPRARSHCVILCALAGCAAAALALRVLLARRGGLWIDEAQLIWTIRFSGVREIIQFVATHDSHPPLFYLLMRGWLWAFGDTEAAALAPGIILGVATVLSLYWTGSRTFSPAAGLIAAALAASSPLLAWHSVEVRPYSFMALLCLLSTHALWSALRDDPAAGPAGGGPVTPGGARRRAWAAYVAATVAMIFTHNWAWLVWGGQGAVVLAWWAVRGGAASGGRASVRAGVVSQLVIAACCAPWVPTLLYQAQHAGHGPAAVSLREFTKTVSSLVFSFGDPARAWVLAALLAAAVWRPVVGVARRVLAGRTASAARPAAPGPALGMTLHLGAPLVAAAAAAAMSWRNNLLVPHALTVISPCLILAVAHVIAGLPQWASPRAPAVLRTAPALLVTALLAAAHVHMLVTEPFVKSNAREVAAAVMTRATPTDLTLVLPQWYGSSFYYYYPLDRPRADYPASDFQGAFRYDDVAQRLASPDAFTRLKRQLHDARRQGRRIWVVTDRRWVDLADGGQHPAHLCAGAYRRVAFARAAEIRLYLDGLYGTPDPHAIPADARWGWSMMDALLYAPPPPPPVGSETYARGRHGPGVNDSTPAAAQASTATER